jgi:hypothetical protein
MEPEKQEFKIAVWAFPLLSWIVAAYFLVGFLRRSAFPPDFSVGTSALAIPALLFLFFPFFKKIKIGKLFELEREVEKAKRELSDFKSEVRSTLSVLSTNVNTIGGMSNQITVNIPALAQLQQARQDVAAAIPAKAKREAEKAESRIIRQSDDDKTMALARTRIDIERTLREALGKQTYFPPERVDSINYASISRLFAMAAEVYPTLPSLQKAFKYVNQVCNAAIHGQRVSDQQADEALALGAEILAALQAFERGDLLP